MSQDELFDIFDEHMIVIGTDTRQNVHKHGYWHQTFHCWICDRSGDGEPLILLQLRHPDKDTFPGYLDISCAGHLLAGETPEDGVRELEEELGVTAKLQDLVYSGHVQQEYVTEQLKDRECTHIYIYECSKPLEEYVFQKSEISGLFQCTVKEYMDLIRGGVTAVTMQGVLYEEQQDELRRVSRLVTAEDITPQSSQYYEVLFRALADYVGDL
ncbi:NUDIX hydrolase [Paenibacillus lemnae]|uniref:NUDIX domain-containing protein n=1 Tax=Paenibacillus lemnae TaxID=1330551 RepID=A0A848M5N0_PAELE|nr:NUDIX domain-containing protein [Paenibacillus lemnae]NMO96438.1 NUDIX domain-containing protein [Paenibacillus lemnae]